MMKKLTSLLLSVVLLVSLLACGASAKTNSTVRVAGLKGPTTMGLVNLLAMEENGTASQKYDLQLYGAADEIVPKLIKGQVDIAAIPANLAATLYQKTNGGIQVMAVNTLGVLYVVEKGNTVHSFSDLKGRTILSTGKGTTPEYVLRYLLTKNGIDPDKDVKIEYYSEGFRGDRPDGCHQEGRHRCSAPALCDGRSDEGQRPACGAGPDEGVEQGL